MATNTTNYNFKKPDESDFYSVQDQNNNWDKADAALKDLDTPTFEDYSGSTTVPDAATAINNIKSKGKLSTIVSNVKAAFKGACLIGQIVNNCVTNNAKLPLSAAQGKALMDLYTQLNSDLVNDAVGYTAATTLYTADLANASGTIKIMVRNAIITIEIVSLTCTPDTPIYGIAGYVGSNKYFYDSDNTGLYIDKSQLYSKKANLGHVMWTFVIR